MKSDFNLDFLYFGQFSYNDNIALDNRFSQAGNNYQKKILSMLNIKSAYTIYPYFIRSNNNFMKHERVPVIYTRTFLPDTLHKLYRIIFDNLKIIFRSINHKEKNILFYNVEYYNILSILFLSKFTSKNNFIIIADFPFYKNSLYSRFAKFVIKNCRGIISLNSNIRVHENSFVLSGLIQESKIQKFDNTLFNKNTLLSGSLGPITGLELALDTFSQLPEHNLFISGRPFRMTQHEFDELISTYSKYPNIKYLGLLSEVKYLELLDNCSIALSLRNPSSAEHDYNFPSKILEYLSVGKYVISTIEYPDLPRDLIFYSRYDVECLRNKIIELCSLENESLEKHSEFVYEYVRKNFTEFKLRHIVKSLMENAQTP